MQNILAVYMEWRRSTLSVIRRKETRFLPGRHLRGNISLSVSVSESTHFLIAAAVLLTHRSRVHARASNEQYFSEILRAHLLLCISHSSLLGLKLYGRKFYVSKILQKIVPPLILENPDRPVGYLSGLNQELYLLIPLSFLQ